MYCPDTRKECEYELSQSFFPLSLSLFPLSITLFLSPFSCSFEDVYLDDCDALVATFVPETTSAELAT